MLLFVRLFGVPGAFLAAWKSTRRAHSPGWERVPGWGPAPPLPYTNRRSQSVEPGKPVSALRILLVRPDHLGDVLLTTPALHALKKYVPDAHITYMVGPWSREVVARHADIDELLTCSFPGFRRAPQNPLAPYFLLLHVARQLRRGNYDLAINLRPDFWWGAALLYLARIPHRVGYALEPGSQFLTQSVPFQEPEHATISNLRLVNTALQMLGHPPLQEPYTPEQYPLQFAPTAEERKWITERLYKEGIDAETTVVVIHPGSGAAVKLWRTESWAACANALASLLTSLADARIILTGSLGEHAMLEEIALVMSSPPILITDATLGQLAALLGRACLVLGVDSGPLHLAVSQSTPTVQIFGPTDARNFGPWGAPQKHIVIASTQRCPSCPTIPCGRLDFTLQELPAHPCVRVVSEQQVLAAIETLAPYLMKNIDRAQKSS